MALGPGSRLGAYEITSLLGSGGMGDVWRARDTNLHRDVALKTLPDSFVSDPNRIARFRREAQVLASLNHPNIGAIYGFEDTPSPNAGSPLHALVLELVAGETLAARLRRGPVPVTEALAFGRQIADALAAAHEHGIIHRDLKPANIVVTPDGVAKVLDFGLAKDLSAELPTVDSSHSPTLTVHGTSVGVVLGTAAYMSPEQAKGRPVDKRSDLWAFGAVVYEMLTGNPAFRGEDVSDILANILTQEPDWQRLPADTPPAVVKLLRRCLEKDRKRRLDSASVARLEIDDTLSTPRNELPRRVSSLHRAAPWAVAATLAIAVVALTRWTTSSTSQMPKATSRFAIVLPPGQRMPAILLDRDLAISPDGRQLVYRVGGSTTGGGRLAMRGLDEIEGHLLPGIDNARSPFFSADGRWVGFFARSESNGLIELRKIATAGGPSISLYQDGSLVSGSAAWSDDDSIIFPQVGGRLFRLSAAGGAPSQLPDTQQHTYGSVAFVSALPGGRGVLYTTRPTGTWFTGATDARIAVLDFKTGTSRVLARGSAPRYIPESGQAGYLVYASAGALLAARFDLDRLSMLGTPAPIVEHVAMSPSGAVDYDVSNTGTLVYVPAAAAASKSLVWVDRQGRETPINLPAREYAFVRISPDGTRVVLTSAEDHHLWMGDLASGTLQQLTFGASEDGFPIWSADGRTIIFTSNRKDGWNLFSLPADGSRDVVQLTNGGDGHFANSAAKGGREILGANFSTSLDVVRFAATGSATSDPPNDAAMPFAIAALLVKTPAMEYDAILSPDERFFAYQSNESGRSEVYVKPLPPTGAVRWQISTSGGSSPLWAPNGRELYYRDSSNAVIAVSYTASAATFRSGTSTRLFGSYAAPSDMFNYGISPDGQRFLMLKDSSIGDPNAVTAHIVVVLDWLQDLKAKVPTK